VDVKWCLTEVMVCIFLKPDDLKYLFMCSLVLCGTLERNVYSSPLPVEFFDFLLLWYKSSLHILDAACLSDI
jgi:hypothetical protein